METTKLQILNERDLFRAYNYQLGQKWKECYGNFPEKLIFIAEKNRKKRWHFLKTLPNQFSDAGIPTSELRLSYHFETIILSIRTMMKTHSDSF